MSSKSASRKRSGPGAVSYSSSLRGGPSDSLHRRTDRPAMSPLLRGPITTFLTFLVLAYAIVPCRAQTSRIFQWSFTQSLSQSLPSCRSFGITVKPFDPANDTHGVPPFYMMSFPVNNMGVPSTTLIGTEESNLAWTVNQPIGAQLLLYVVDSQGSSGGVGPKLFTVTTGDSTQCIPAASTQPPFTVTANVTNTLTTCQPWGLTIQGGAPPYNVTLAALNSPVVTNVTMGPLDDAFTYIDRADPGTQLIAAISDLNGRWATGTPIVSTTGSSNYSCVGLVSSSGNSTVIKQQVEAALATSQARHKAAVTAGVVVSVIVILILVGVGVFLYLRRRKVIKAAEQVTPRQFAGGVNGIDATPAVQEAGTHILSINAFINPPSPPHSPKSPTASNVSRSPSAAIPAPPDRRRMVGTRESESVTSSNVPSTHGTLSVRNPHPHRPAAFSSFPTASVRRSAKSIEAGLTTSMSEDSEFFDLASTRPLVERSVSAGPASVAQRLPTPMRSASTGANGVAGQEIIYQHQDAGLVRELPPPYIDRGTQESQS